MASCRREACRPLDRAEELLQDSASSCGYYPAAVSAQPGWTCVTTAVEAGADFAYAREMSPVEVDDPVGIHWFFSVDGNLYYAEPRVDWDDELDDQADPWAMTTSHDLYGCAAISFRFDCRDGELCLVCEDRNREASRCSPAQVQ